MPDIQPRRLQVNMVPWSSGQDASLSRWNQGFDSPRHYQNKNLAFSTSAGFFIEISIGFGIAPFVFVAVRFGSFRLFLAKISRNITKISRKISHEYPQVVHRQ